jgi:hypothetical protein
MTDAREVSLKARYHTIRAYGAKLEASLPNAREVGLVAYEPIRRIYDAKIIRCSKLLRRIEDALSGDA